jgi:hypothetical protein
MPAGQDMQHWSERDLPSEPPSLSAVLSNITRNTLADEF